MSKKLNDSEVKSFIESQIFYGDNKVKCISGYINSNTPIDLVDSSGYKYSQTLSNIKKAIKLNRFFDITKRNKFANHNLDLYCKTNYKGVLFVSFKDGYVDTICKCEKENHQLLAQFRKSYRCARCSKNEKHNIENIRLQFCNRGYKLISDEYINSHSHLIYYCNKHRDKGVLRISHTSFLSGNGCKYCGYESQSKMKVGSNSSSWKGGITTIRRYLREQISDWKQETMKSNNYKCALSNDWFDVIHHKHSFNDIIKELIKDYDMPIYKNISQYTQDQLDYYSDICRKLHGKYGYGVCLKNSIHRLYHRLYGYEDNNTIQQWQEFEKDFKSGKYREGIDY